MVDLSHIEFIKNLNILALKDYLCVARNLDAKSLSIVIPAQCKWMVKGIGLIDNELQLNLWQEGFKSGYYRWTSHGERRPTIPPMVSSNSFCGSSMAGEHNFYEEMVMYGSIPSLGELCMLWTRLRFHCRLVSKLQRGRGGKDKGGWIVSKMDTMCIVEDPYISAREHAKRMAELNREPTWFELYERLHRPKEKPNEWFKEEQAQINSYLHV
ncbi:hypothetical protein L195_g002705 [Trifolium pratense]|uniref:Uncharacterized protein n=1 Tax=Trifolium pratense TaxID=57577 RepID=A0A2K3NT82_TRIPR|nr:hypothetical protein L195_g002705 [Trifolium pratense]